MRLIDVDEVLRIFKKWIPQLELPEDAGDKRGVESCIMILEDSPTVDAVEVVRCKDCKHYHTHNRSVRFDCKELYCCRSALKKVDPEDFCSFGERKDNE